MLTLPLHPYQEPAVRRFLDRGNLLIAYDMGLGKTPIAIACAEELLEAGKIETVLLVVPASLRYQWAQALAKFTDLPTRELKVKGETLTVPTADSCVIVDGGSAQRRAKLALARESADYVITSYNTVLTDIREIRKLNAGLVVLDEASAIKTFGAERTLKIKRSLTAPYRIALTGTPVENRPEEAFSIMEWVDPGVLGAFDLFDKTYIRRDRSGNVKGHKNLALFNRRLSVAMVRRSRAEPGVREFLPDVDHQTWYVEPDTATLRAYSTIADDLLDELLNVRGSATFDVAAYYQGTPKYNESTPLGRVMARQQAAELLLDHPQLFVQSAILYETTKVHGSRYCYEQWNEGLIDPLGSKLDYASPKLDYLAARVHDILGFEGNKILIFSRYPEMLNLIADQLMFQYGTQSVQYHGRMSATAKAAAVAQFGSQPRLRVFLSSHAGAYGNDMKMASHLINYDLAWSAGRADQINGRHQRASSEFSRVFIGDLIMAGTLEERKLATLEYKRSLSAAVVDGKMPRDGRIENDVITLTRFLQERQA